jgi:hypothetical protein
MSHVSPPEPLRSSHRRRRLGIWLFAVFAASLILGAGPGVLLVDPLAGTFRWGPAEASSFEGTPALWFGLPVLYVWGLFWYGVQAAVVVAAYVWVWRRPEADSEGAG